MQPAANVSPGAAASGADLPSTARMTRRFSSPPISSLGAADRRGRAAEAAVQRALARIWRQPSASRSLAERSVVSGLPIAPPDARQVEQRARRGEAVGDRLQHALLAQAAREVVVGRVGGVLAHARVGQRVAAVEVQRAAPEAPRVAVEAVRDDLRRVVDRDAAERVDELAEAREVDQDDVVDRDARQVLARS